MFEYDFGTMTFMTSNPLASLTRSLVGPTLPTRFHILASVMFYDERGDLDRASMKIHVYKSCQSCPSSNKSTNSHSIKLSLL